MVTVFAYGLGDWYQSKVESYQRFKEKNKEKKGYLMPLCLTLSIIKYGSRLRGTIQGNE